MPRGQKNSCGCRRRRHDAARCRGMAIEQEAVHLHHPVNPIVPRWRCSSPPIARRPGGRRGFAGGFFCQVAMDEDGRGAVLCLEAYRRRNDISLPFPRHRPQIGTAMIVGFALRYGLREWVSHRRRRAERLRRGF